MGTFQIIFKALPGGRWQEEHFDEEGNSAVVGVRDYLPPGARPVDPGAAAEEAESRQERREGDAYDRYARRSSHPDFETIKERMRERVKDDPEAAEVLDTDHANFCTAYDSLRLDDLATRHRARLAEIKQAQHSSNAMERSRADLDLLAEHEAYVDAAARIQAGESDE